MRLISNTEIFSKIHSTTNYIILYEGEKKVDKIDFFDKFGFSGSKYIGNIVSDSKDRYFFKNMFYKKF